MGHFTFTKTLFQNAPPQSSFARTKDGHPGSGSSPDFVAENPHFGGIDGFPFTFNWPMLALRLPRVACFRAAHLMPFVFRRTPLRTCESAACRTPHEHSYAWLGSHGAGVM